MRSKAIKMDSLNAVLMALTPANRLVCRISLATGLRVGDVLALKTEQLQRGRFTITEEKTGKRRRMTIPEPLRTECLRQAGRIYVFEHRTDRYRHRTRQAVWRDLNRIAKFFRISGVSPHSLRKTFAKQAYMSGEPMTAIQKHLLHSSETITALYALAEEVEKK